MRQVFPLLLLQYFIAMTDTFKLRLIQPGELPLVLQLLKEAAIAIQAKGLDQWDVWLDPPQEKISWIEEGLAQQEFFAVENQDNELVGVFRLADKDLLYWGEQDVMAGYVHSLVVRKQFAGRQLGTIILNMVEDKLLAEGCHLFRLDCNAGNAWLCSYYEQQGFRKVGEVKMPHSLNNLYEKQIG
ncbi:GNAT family N-acetyltransferase [Chitinophaga flava]|uniref:GNAT family N-acetyltransferase n=1 Tax=Chitinophaga flava TaxID=2259036 RepID=A0A365XZZ3_9BACT|nr:GNAT family N-acetyltransferase [Chitinophaga flava]RBL91244.1 GNAT family N-acetyltransferase [Chitinophaga flava]